MEKNTPNMQLLGKASANVVPQNLFMEKILICWGFCPPYTNINTQ